ncbi:MAG TPA: hypothetical protein VFC19_29055 [Candidatus Limnocylindrales bacterium]|nr:hypothetical protein [Candidatus Limnocylindrales bacterium]
MELDEFVDDELQRLAIAGLAMFNRSSQFVAEEDLNDDLAALLLGDSDAGGDRASQTRAQRLVGRFFFVHVAAARFGDTLRTYEFLHATFGKYLVAWLITRALPQPRTPRSLTRIRTERNDGLLAAVMSHALLVERKQILTFLRHLASGLPERDRVRDLILESFRACFDGVAWSSFTQYRPVRKNLLERMSVYSANLLLIAVALAPGSFIPAAALFGELPPEEHRQRWKQLAQFWLSVGGNNGIHSLSEEIEVVSHEGAMLVSRRHTTYPALNSGDIDALARTNDFVLDPTVAALLWTVDPIFRAIGTQGFTAAFSDGENTPARALLEVMFTAGSALHDERYLRLVRLLEQLPPEVARGPYVTLLISHLLSHGRHIDEPELYFHILSIIDGGQERSWRVFRRFLHSLVRLNPGLEHQRRQLVREAMYIMLSPPRAGDATSLQDFMNDLIDEAAADAALTPIVLEVFAAPSIWSLALHPGLPWQFLSWMDAMPPGVRQQIADGQLDAVVAAAGEQWPIDFRRNAPPEDPDDEGPLPRNR